MRKLTPDDSLEDLTELLHRAYAPLAASGLQYLASHQSVDVTRRRCFAPNAHCFVAELKHIVVGTITLYTLTEQSHCKYYTKPGIARFGQFAVEPSLQRTGVGRALMDYIENTVQSLNMSHIACDTAEHAHHLIAYYKRRQYQQVDTVDWPVTNYVSVVLSKQLQTS
ncbi:MAG: GNAT family N-acetyltransferase [Phycisphaeraceae bacterium]|nr:GNAT family N-acetyltransferase [Phycisphaerales bacterium]MCB9861420.1 GNAT family N-acetyltransferase [Phycisphaeraceae bacterium]